MSQLATPPIALQLYTLRTLLPDALEPTLHAVRDTGYRHVELAGLHGRSPAEMRDILDQIGLEVVAAHVPLTRFETDLAGVAEEAKVLGYDWVVVPWISPDDRSPELIDSLPPKLDAWAGTLADQGLKLAYHNHQFEFEIARDGVSLFDALVQRTDPSLVFVELDVYWTAVAGIDPSAKITELGERVRLLHAKDQAPDGGYTNVGQGYLDWALILDSAKEAGVEAYIVEHDDPPAPLDDIRVSFAALSEALQ
ncbi:MAG: hypothetical protein AVDCRST_MAG70-1737 [uncultured Thermomicrobiales bacterium]|uniref:Xylose isomerase-like TIM barrel domain-containing protein n=1 Tax=uncultured Thermomicrobiales bacterium TaxID=1645740 RepID=A0A6J4UYZ6_9BACT|nr:MAG: hypothetical protein AVDCRST_MAG70-1737 [uncultured Thermomicrobiales bacterium]